MPNSNRYLFKYPANVGQPPFDKWIRFDAKAMRHILRRDMLPEVGAVDITLASAVLYLPETTMQSALKSTWTQQDLGVLTGALVQAMATGRTMGDVTTVAMGNFIGASLNDNFEKINRAWSDTEARPDASGYVKPKTMGDRVLEAAPKIAEALEISGGVAMAALAKLLIPGFAMTGLEAATGSKLNPRTEQLFDSQEYREYDFKFTLVPRTLEEGVAIDNIIQFFQFYMLPKYGKGDTVMGYPYEFEVGIYSSGNIQADGKGTLSVDGWIGEAAPRDEKGRIKKAAQLKRVTNIGRCIVLNCDVDHAGAGKTSFIRADDGEIFPTITTLSVKLREVALLDRTSPLINRDPELLRESDERK